MVTSGPNWTTLQATAGTIGVFYATGLGSTTPQVPAGQAAPKVPPLAVVANPISLTICGVQVPANQIYYAGLTPGLSGLYQINALIPTVCANADPTVSQLSLVQVAVK